MNNDEVKAALEYWHRNEPRGYRHDLVTATLAAACAAEHPVDEDEPITPEWLNGLLPWDDIVKGHSGNPVWSIYHHGHELEVDRASGDWFTLSINEHGWPIPLYTRGQLLRLLKELEQ